MTIENIIGVLIASGNAERVASKFKEHPEVDIFYDDGSFFNVAIAHSEIGVLKVLFDVFNKKLQQYTHSEESLHAKMKLSNILHAAIDSSFPSEDTVILLKPYMYEDDECNSRQGDDIGDGNTSSNDHHITPERSSSERASDSHITLENLSHLSHKSLDTATWVGLVGDADSPEPVELA